MKSDSTDGCVENGLRQPMLYSYVLDKPPRYKVFFQPEYTIKKINKPVLNTITLYLQANNNEEVDYNGETLTLLNE